MYENYNETKASAYNSKIKIYRWLVRKVPFALLKLIFPVVSHLNFKNKTVLDIGSGTGLYSAIMRLNGNKVIEIEPYLDNCYGNTEVIKSTFEEYEANRSYDVIICLDVLEHIDQKHIDEFFKKIKVSLVEHGIFIAKVPNASALAGLESHFGDLTHVRGLNTISLTTIIVNNGLKVDYIKGVNPNLSIRRMLYRIISLPFSTLMKWYLLSYGVNGEIHSPSIICKARR